MSSLKLRTTAANDIKSTTGIETRTSHAVWWIKNPPKSWTQRQYIPNQLSQQYQHIQQLRTIQQQQQQQQHQHQRLLLPQKRRKQSFGQDMGDLFRNISLHGYSKLLDPELTLVEKLIWLALHVTTMVALFIVLSFTWEQFVAQYFVINLHDPLYPVENVPFPAVSICSNNRISANAALKYAEELSNKDPNKRGTDYFMDHIKDFSNLYYRQLSIQQRDNERGNQNFEESFLQFQTFLEQYSTEENETFFDTLKIMKMITPKCEKFIVQCLLAGVEIECFSNTTFQNSMTTYGPCCTFNTQNSYKSRTSQNSYVPSDLGLTVILNTSKSDDFRQIFNSDGYAVIIHTSDDFPDVASGGSQEVFPPNGEEAFVSIKARIIDTEEALRSYSPQTRNCYFDDEAPSRELLLRNAYSFTNCITRCRIRSIQSLCNCIPFFMPLYLAETNGNLIFCTLEHIDCLLRYTWKWRNVLTQRQALPELRREIEESVYCPLCRPSCDDVQYEVSLMSLPLDRFRASTSYERLIQKYVDLKDISVLRVHFKEAHSLYYRRIIGNAWFEVMSTVGNILSIFVGFSMLAIFEIVYYFLKNSFNGMKQFIEVNIKKEKHKHYSQKERHTKSEKTMLYIYP